MAGNSLVGTNIDMIKLPIWRLDSCVTLPTTSPRMSDIHADSSFLSARERESADACKPFHARFIIRMHDGLNLGMEVAGFRCILRSGELRKNDARQEVVEARVPCLFDEE